MSVAYLKSKVEERAGLTDASTAILDKCAAESRDPSPEERAQLDGWATRCTALDGEIAVLETQFRGNSAFSTLLNRMSRTDEDTERRDAARRREPAPEQRKSVGAQFVESAAFTDYQGSGTSKRVEFGGFLEQRAAITTADLSIPAFQWDGPTGATYSSPLLNVIGHEPVTSGSVEYTVWGAVSDAGEVAEGDLKPEATLAETPESGVLATYAHWKAVTRQALEDKPRVQSIVEGKLRRGLTQKLEAAAAAALNAAAFAGIGPIADLSSGIRAAVGDVQVNGYQPNAVLLNPVDFANLDIAAADAANNGPNAFPTYWGMTPVAVKAVPAGTAYVGDFKEALTWFDRNVTSVYMTDSHADYFVRNLLVILAETRALFDATDVMAAVKITVGAAPGGAAATSSK